MKFEITSCIGGSVLFSAETESMRLCVELAVKSGANLRDADLRFSDLIGANLRDADLRFSDLRGANLRFSDLRGADLRFSNLRFSDLRGADLRFSNLRGADLRDANLRFSNLRGSDLRFSDLIGADLSDANLRGSDLRGANLSGANGDTIAVTDRPLIIGPIGSRADYMTAWQTDAGIYIKAGCFWDTLAAFEAAVTKTHGDNEHAIHYRAAIALIRARFPEQAKAVAA